MVMGAVGDIRNYLKKMPYTLRVGNVPGGDTEFISIQAAINYAAPFATAANPWTVYIYPGIYDEAITCSSWVNLKGIGPKGSVVIAQNNATIITGAQYIEIADLTIRLTNSTDSRSLFYDNTPGCTIRLTNLVMEIVADFSDAHRLFFVSGAGGDYTIERCSAVIGVTAIGFATIFVEDTLTLHLNNNNFSAVAGDHIYLHYLGTVIGVGNRWVGAATMFDVTRGTVTLDGDAILCTGAWLHAGTTGTTITLRNCAIEAPVVAGNLATVRMKNCSYRAIQRTGTGNIVDESPDLKDAPWHVEKWTWQAALAAAQVAVRGIPLDAGSGQVIIETLDSGAGVMAVETSPELARALGNEFTPARTPRFLTQISAHTDDGSTEGQPAFDPDVAMFFGLRAALGPALPAHPEHHAGFIWTGAAFNASSNDGVATQTTALTTPSDDAQHQLEVIVFGGVTTVGWVEFYVDGVLVATHTLRIPTAVLDWQHIIIGLTTGGGDTISVTVRNGGTQECPA